MLRDVAERGLVATEKMHAECTRDAAYLRALVVELEKAGPQAEATAARHRAFAEQLEARRNELSYELSAAKNVLAAAMASEEK